MSRVLAVALCVLLVGCGGSSPTSPSPAPAPAPTPALLDISGRWTGSVDGTHPTTGPTRYQVDVTLTQAGDQVTGTYRQEPDSGANLRGEITGTLSGVGSDAVFTGTTTWDALSFDPAVRCTAVAAVRGPAARLPMTWTSDDVSFRQCAGTLTSVRWVLTKQ